MKTSVIPLARTVVQHCKARGIKNIVISPGSRNAPLTLGFTGDPWFNCHSIVDERCAGFFALGMAQQLREGVAVVCTSGSALLNYYPAVAEAYYSNIPLVVISADRPLYKIDIGDGQTIRQDKVFQRHIGKTALLKQDVTHATEAIRASGTVLPEKNSDLLRLQDEIRDFNESCLSETLYIALHKFTPVHLNVPLEEPLYQTRPPGEGDVALVIPSVVHKESQENLEPYGILWKGASRKMVLVGAAYPGAIPQTLVDILAKDPATVVFTETTSNCHHPDFFQSIDSIIAPIENSPNRHQLSEKLQPEILLTMGGMVVSKKIKAFLRQFRPRHHWHVGTNTAYNTYYALSHHFKMSASNFLRDFGTYMVQVNSEYRPFWTKVKNDFRMKRGRYLERIPFSDFLAFHDVISNIPHNYQVQLANSSTVRYTQLFDMHASLRVFCNRGTSGIDGSTSTAIGASLIDEHPTLLITGDLSLLYDSNGLWNSYIRPDFRIIVVNNGGGGIFRILPGHEETVTFETFFETTHELDVSTLCRFHGITHYEAGDENTLKEQLSTFFNVSDIPQLLEIKTPRSLNNNILLAYFEFLS
jgi:2-succinyl-5-enolpyruvyl-6-hydroxy-3-cyclohexene-1-carboxylate synthase